MTIADTKIMTPCLLVQIRGDKISVLVGLRWIGRCVAFSTSIAVFKNVVECALIFWLKFLNFYFWGLFKVNLLKFLKGSSTESFGWSGFLLAFSELINIDFSYLSYGSNFLGVLYFYLSFYLSFYFSFSFSFSLSFELSFLVETLFFSLLYVRCFYKISFKLLAIFTVSLFTTFCPPLPMFPFVFANSLLVTLVCILDLLLLEVWLSNNLPKLS